MSSPLWPVILRGLAHLLPHILPFQTAHFLLTGRLIQPVIWNWAPHLLLCGHLHLLWDPTRYWWRCPWWASVQALRPLQDRIWRNILHTPPTTHPAVLRHRPWSTSPEQCLLKFPSSGSPKGSQMQKQSKCFPCCSWDYTSSVHDMVAFVQDTKSAYKNIIALILFYVNL